MCAKLTQTQGEIAGQIGGHPDCFSHHGDALSFREGRECMLVREFRILLGEPARHDQVGHDELSIVLVKARELTPGLTVEILGCNIRVDRGKHHALVDVRRWTFGPAGGPRTVSARCTPPPTLRSTGTRRARRTPVGCPISTGGFSVPRRTGRSSLAAGPTRGAGPVRPTRTTGPAVLAGSSWSTRSAGPVAVVVTTRTALSGTSLRGGSLPGGSWRCCRHTLSLLVNAKWPPFRVAISQ